MPRRGQERLAWATTRRAVLHGSALRGGLLSARAESNQRTARGEPQIECGFAPSDMLAPPWTPILRGPPIRPPWLVNAKARVAQLTGFRSMTAAAELPAAFGCFSSWLEARLLSGRGSSAARMDGGNGTGLVFRRGRSQTGPREGHTPGWLLSAFGRFTFSPSPTVLKKLFWAWVGEALGPPAGGMPRGHPHPSRFACHLPP